MEWYVVYKDDFKIAAFFYLSDAQEFMKLWEPICGKLSFGRKIVTITESEE